MKVKHDTLKIKTTADSGMLDLTLGVQSAVHDSGLKDGIAVVFCPGSTGAISTLEYEPGLVKDIPSAMDKIAPRDGIYAHHEKWHDDNGSGHVKATIIGPTLTVPFIKGRLALGEWQQIVFIEFDTKDRQRELIIQMMGE